MEWLKEKSAGKPHIESENLWFAVDFPSNQSIEPKKCRRENFDPGQEQSGQNQQTLGRL